MVRALASAVVIQEAVEEDVELEEAAVVAMVVVMALEAQAEARGARQRPTLEQQLVFLSPLLCENQRFVAATPVVVVVAQAEAVGLSQGPMQPVPRSLSRMTSG